MFPCPLHNKLESEAQANVIRRSKLVYDQGVEVKWANHEIHKSMIIINPPTKSNPNPEDGIALIDLSLPYLDTLARAKFEITKSNKARYFPTWSNHSALPGERRTVPVTKKKTKTGGPSSF